MLRHDLIVAMPNKVVHTLPVRHLAEPWLWSRLFSRLLGVLGRDSDSQINIVERPLREKLGKDGQHRQSRTCEVEIDQESIRNR